MKNKILLVLIIIAVIFSVLSIIPRYNIENNNKNVELIIDNENLTKLANKIDKSRDNILISLQRNGLTGVAVYCDSIKKLISDKDARLITGNELERIGLLTSNINPLYQDFSFQKDSAFLIISDKNIKKRVLSILPTWSKEYEIKYREKNDKLIIYFKKWKDKYLDLAIGFNKKYINNIKNIDLQVVPRPDNNIKGYNQFEFINKSNFKLLIFSGSEVLGYKDNLKNTAQIMNNNKIKFGKIESFIAKQSGSDRIARLLNYNLVRVHSVQQQEMDKYNTKKLIDRYLRAVRERNVRILYLKPFLEGEKDKLLKKNLEFIKMLTAELKAKGFNKAEAEPYQYFNTPVFYLLLISTGIFAGGIFLLEKLLSRRLRLWFWIIMLSFICVEVILITSGNIILLRQLLALGSSIIFPTLAIIIALDKSRSQRWIFSFSQAIGISLLGSLFLVASLSELSFIVKVNQFRGVKLSFILPLLLVSYYYYKKYLCESEDNNIYNLTKSFLETKIKIKHLLLLLLLIIGGIIYIGRTGNYPLLPVPAWEIILRDVLEKYLYVRPRFKAFLFGHPFLIMVLALMGSSKQLITYLFLLLATVGQITILNTFSHTHTALKISLIRFANGIWLGLAVAIILLVILKFLDTLKVKLND